MKRIAALSDIHGNILALEAVVADVTKRSIDTVVNLGDHLSGPLWPKETMQFLRRQEWIHIAGNHDRRLFACDPGALGLSDAYAFKLLNDADRKWLRSLPVNQTLEGGAAVFHGTPLNDSEYLLETVQHGRARLASRVEIKERLGGKTSPVMLCGHTHVPRIVQVEDGMLIVNPGSVGLPAYEDDFPEPHVIESGSPHARYAVLECDNTHWTVELITVPYDHRSAVEQARNNGRPDWAVALQTGFMHL